MITKIQNIFNIYQIFLNKHNFHSRNWNSFFLHEGTKIWLKDIINQDYLDLGLNEFKIQESLFFNKMKIYFHWDVSFISHLQYDIESEEWYNFRIFCDNIWTFLLSWLWKFYFLLHKKDTKQEKEIVKFLKSIWYEEISPELLETELDIIGNDFMPYDAWVEKAKEQYKENYINDDDYYIDEMNAPGYPKDRVKDFETYCKEEYEGPFKVSHLLLGENANWVLE